MGIKKNRSDAFERRARKLRRHIGRHIKLLRCKAGWTQEELAERLNVSARYVRFIETGKQNVTLNTLQKMAEAFSIKVAELFLPLPSRAAFRSVGSKEP